MKPNLGTRPSACKGLYIIELECGFISFMGVGKIMIVACTGLIEFISENVADHATHS